MLTLPASVRVFVARGATDLRRSFDRLSAQVQEVLRQDPLSGHVFAFFNRRRDRVKLLVWERDGFWLLYKRLESGTFAVLDREEINARELYLLLEGIEVVRQRVRYERLHIATRYTVAHGALFLSASPPLMLTDARGGGVVVTNGAEPQAVLDELSHEIDRLNKENTALRQRIQLLTHRLFGRRSEKGVPVVAQGVLPFEPAVGGPVQPESTDESRWDETSERVPLRRRHPGRRRLPADLPREQIELVPPASERHCTTCDTAKVRIGADTTEELDNVPASFVIREYVRPKYACAKCRQGVVQAVLPARPIEKGLPGPGLLAHVVTSKYSDHLPLYRPEQIFQRHGVDVTRRTLSEWNGAVADLLEPIVRAMHREQVCQSPWIQCDDTTLDVQDPSRAPEIRTGHLWVYRGELGDAVYDFTWTRNRDGPLKMLANYRGYLQVDAAPAYDDVFAQHPEIIEVGCMAHARRYFKEAMATAAIPCAQVLAIIGQLYGIERAASDRYLDAPARQRLRQEQARPILEKLHAYLREQQATALPKSPLGAAIGYALRNWTALTRYTEDERLKVDNNGAEQALRPLVLGRKNYLFAGSEAAAHRTAILCSLVQTCKHLQINPFVYLRDVIERVSTHPARLVLELTPREWKRVRQDSGTQAAA